MHRAELVEYPAMRLDQLGKEMQWLLSIYRNIMCLLLRGCSPSQWCNEDWWNSLLHWGDFENSWPKARRMRMAFSRHRSSPLQHFALKSTPSPLASSRAFLCPRSIHKEAYRGLQGLHYIYEHVYADSFVWVRWVSLGEVQRAQVSSIECGPLIVAWLFQILGFYSDANTS